MSDLKTLVQSCTVRVETYTYNGDLVARGSGFFVAPGLVLTCAHVVQFAYEDPQQYSIRIGQDDERTCAAQIEKCVLGEELEPGIAFPDVALLAVNWGDHLCVYLHKSLFSTIEVDTTLYSYGFSDIHPILGEPCTFSVEGTYGTSEKLVKLKASQVRGGMSGAPLLDETVGKVCGIIKRTRDEDSPLGGIAIPIKAVLTEFEELWKKQIDFHDRNDRWKNALTSDQFDKGGYDRDAALAVVPLETIINFSKHINDFQQKLHSSFSSVILVEDEISGIGKSTLLKRLMHDCRVRQFRFSYIEFQETNSPGLNEVIQRIGYHLELSKIQSPQDLARALKNLNDMLPSEKCVIFFDGFEYAPESIINWLLDDFLHLLRPGSNFPRNVSNILIIIAGQRKIPSISELNRRWGEGTWRDYITTSSELGELKPWTEDEIREYAQVIGLNEQQVGAVVKALKCIEGLEKIQSPVTPFTWSFTMKLVAEYNITSHDIVLARMATSLIR